MANVNVTHSEVKSICDSLECSPSQHDAHGNYGGKSSLSPKNSQAAAGGKQTGDFKMTDRGRTLPHYTKGFAKKASQA
jgi:hypothetical protein